MREEYLGTIMVLLFDLVIGSLIWVGFKFAAPVIASILTVILSCVAGWATFKVCKFGFNKLKEKWISKRKQ